MNNLPCKNSKFEVRRLLNRIIEVLVAGNTPGLGPHVPNDWARSGWFNERLFGIEYSLSFTNDAFELNFNWRDSGEPETARVRMQMRCRVFRQLAIWYFYRWAVFEWCGLRRWLYFRYIHWKVEQYSIRREHERSDSVR